MNKEINTIIANLEGCIGMFDYLLTPTESNLLVSYIEELQQENKKINGAIQTYDILLKANVEENEQLKEKNEDLELNWEIIRQYCLDEQIPEESDEYNSYIEFSNSVYDNILNKMQELEQGSRE